MRSQPEHLNSLADEFLAAWQIAHGYAAGHARVLDGPEHLAILIEGAFTQAERKLAQEPQGLDLLREYVLELLQQISGELAVRIEDVVRRPVRASDVNVNLKADQVMFIFSLDGDEKSQ